MNKIYKSVLSVAAAAIVAGASMAPAAVYAWGDSNNGRQTYTMQQANDLDHITFNSITDGSFGDERNFVGAKLSTDNGNIWHADTLNVKDGDVVTIRLYVHNNNPNGEDTRAIATGVSTSFSLPTTVGSTQVVTGYITASNATPARYWDEVRLTSSEDFYLEYVSGSAKYTNNVGTFNLADSIVTGGATVGYRTMNGNIPGCYSYSGQATIQVRVHSSVTAKLSKTVRKANSGTQFTEAVQANIGEEVEFQIEYKNLLGETVNNVMIRDVLPYNLQYVNDSTYLYNSVYPNGAKIDENTIATTGLNIGSYQTNGSAYVRFKAKVIDESLACGDTQLVNWASSTVNSKVTKDDASVIVKKSGDVCKGVTPRTIVNTGAGTIVTGAIGAGAVVTTLGYFVASRKKF